MPRNQCNWDRCLWVAFLAATAGMPLAIQAQVPQPSPADPAATQNPSPFPPIIRPPVIPGPNAGQPRQPEPQPPVTRSPAPPPVPSTQDRSSFPSIFDPASPGQPAGPGQQPPVPAQPPFASISDLPSQTEQLGSLAGLFGVRLAAPPNVIGDFLGRGTRLVNARVTVPFAFHTKGFLLAGAASDPNATVGFRLDGTGPIDFTTIGSGTPNPNPNTFAIDEPLPPNRVPTSPGPGFVYDGGTAVYTNSNASTTAAAGPFADDEFWYAAYSYSKDTVLHVPSANALRIKIAENNSPIPRDRYYFDYKFFHDVAGNIGDVDRYTFGIERTFANAQRSLDIRLPIASTLATDQVIDLNQSGSRADMRDTVVGNISLIYKEVLYEVDRFLISGGLGTTFPSGDDSRMFRGDGVQFLVIDNESIHVIPYMAGLWIPSNQTFFLQSFVQLDVDVNGNTVYGDMSGGVLPEIGVLQDPTMLLVEVSGGYWLYQSADRMQHLRRIAAIAEFHYATTLQDGDSVGSGSLVIADPTPRLDILNSTFGFNFQFANSLTITAGMSFPLSDSDDRQFEREVSVLANWYY